MLNKNINKVRRIVKAYTGLSIPSGNPYMTTNGLAIPGNSITQQNLLGTDYGAEFMNMAEQIMAPTNKLIDFNAKMGDIFSFQLQQNRKMAQMNDLFKNDKNTDGINTPISPSLQQLFQKLGGWNTIGSIAGLSNNLLFGKQRVQDSAETQGLDNLYNMASGVVGSSNPILGAGMQIGGLVAGATRKLTGGTSQRTGADKFGDSTLGQLTGFGIINAAFGKKTRDFSADKSTIEQVGGAYSGLVRDINKAEDLAGQKYGLASSGKRKKTNNFIDKTESKMFSASNVAKNASDLSSIATNMSDLNHLQYGFNLNGGYDQRYMRAAKNGAILKRIKKINFRKQGGEIVGAINLDNWQPEITEAPIEWTPVITFKDGGKSQKVDGITGESPKITFESWYKMIPEDRNDTTFYNLRRAFELAPREELEAWRTSSVEDLIQGKNHLNSVYLNPETGIYEFMKSRNHPTLKYELDWYYSNDPDAIEFRNKYDLDKSEEYYKYIPKKFKDGGKNDEQEDLESLETTQKNIIPEGALHAHKHHMENADNLTKKGIPVIDNEGEQQAEIERNEIIFTLEVTKKLEELYSKYYDYEYSQKEKDEVAIEAGKLLVEEILFNTEDRTSLIEQIQV